MNVAAPHENHAAHRVNVAAPHENHAAHRVNDAALHASDDEGHHVAWGCHLELCQTVFVPHPLDSHAVMNRDVDRWNVVNHHQMEPTRFDRALVENFLEHATGRPFFEFYVH